MHLVVSTFFNALLIGLFLVAFGANFGRLHPTIDLIGQFLLPAIIGAAVVALLAAFAGRYFTAIAAVAALLLNLALAWPWLQSPTPQAAVGPRLTLMTFNVLFKNQSLDRLADFITEAKPDVLILQEVMPHVRTQLDKVADQYPYRIECWQQRPCDSLILSRFPMTDLTPSLPEPNFRRPLGAATVDIEGRKLTVFAAHLSLPPLLNGSQNQIGETEELVRTIKSQSGARVLAGDFNAATWGAIMTMLREGTGMSILTGPGATWPTFLPFHGGIPIDHVLASDDLILRSRKVLTAAGSDHRAVLTEIAFKQ